MRKILNILAATALAVGFASCDEVKEDERFSMADGINPERKVLVEEFTGQYCPNCPLGHEALDGIKKMYGENAVVVSIHAGDMASDFEGYGLKTPEGDTYAAAYGVQQYPSAVINRNTSALSDRSLWQGSVLMGGLMAPSVSIDLKAEISGGELKITSDLAARSSEVSGSYQVWITEDNIDTFQQDGDNVLPSYIHNHVYRASVNGVGGESVKIPTSATSLTHTIKLNSLWNTSNLNVVAFVYNNSGVLQAQEIRVK